ncbi:hypothetical protein B484DRAFT_409247, partial [Ochromonadaceae sp. CCMP2298]
LRRRTGACGGGAGNEAGEPDTKRRRTDKEISIPVLAEDIPSLPPAPQQTFDPLLHGSKLSREERLAKGWQAGEQIFADDLDLFHVMSQATLLPRSQAEEDGEWDGGDDEERRRKTSRSDRSSDAGISKEHSGQEVVEVEVEALLKELWKTLHETERIQIATGGGTMGVANHQV